MGAEGSNTQGAKVFCYAEACLTALRMRATEHPLSSVMASLQSYSTQNASEGTTNNESTSTSGGGGIELASLASYLVYDFLSSRYASIPPSGTPSLSLFEYIESPLAKLTRQGMGLLSSGLGALWGGGGSDNSSTSGSSALPSVGQHPVLVLYMVGGVSYKEIAEVRDMVQKLKSNGLLEHEVEVYIGSNKSVSGMEIVVDLL